MAPPVYTTSATGASAWDNVGGSGSRYSEHHRHDEPVACGLHNAESAHVSPPRTAYGCGYPSDLGTGASNVGFEMESLPKASHAPASSDLGGGFGSSGVQQRRVVASSIPTKSDDYGAEERPYVPTAQAYVAGDTFGAPVHDYSGPNSTAGAGYNSNAGYAGGFVPQGQPAAYVHVPSRAADEPWDEQNGTLRHVANRCFACLCSCLCLFMLVAMIAPPGGSTVWFSFGLCRAESGGAALPPSTGLESASQSDGRSHWVSLPLHEEEACPASAVSEPTSTKVERENFPPFGGIFDSGEATFFVTVMRDGFTEGSVSFRILSQTGSVLLPPKSFPLIYLTNAAVACNTSTTELCTQATEAGVDGAPADGTYVPAVSRRRRLQEAFDEARHAAVERARALFRRAASAGDPAARREGAGSAAMAVVEADDGAGPTSRRMLKGGSFTGGSSRARSGGGSSFFRPRPAVSGRAYVSRNVAAAHAYGPHYAYHASPTSFSRPSVYTAGTAFILLHHGNRHGYGHGYSSACATSGCEIAVDTNLASDQLLDSTFKVRSKDFPLTFELLGAELSLNAASTAQTPLLLFGFQPL